MIIFFKWLWSLANLRRGRFAFARIAQHLSYCSALFVLSQTPRASNDGRTSKSVILLIIYIQETSILQRRSCSVWLVKERGRGSAEWLNPGEHKHAALLVFTRISLNASSSTSIISWSVHIYDEMYSNVTWSELTREVKATPIQSAASVVLSSFCTSGLCTFAEIIRSPSSLTALFNTIQLKLNSHAQLS